MRSLVMYLCGLYTLVYISVANTDIDSTSTRAFWNKEDVESNLILEVS